MGWDKKQNEYESLTEDVEELKGEKENLKSEVEKKKKISSSIPMR